MEQASGSLSSFWQYPLCRNSRIRFAPDYVRITSDSGHVLIDRDLPDSVQQIVSNIRSLGFRMEDVKLILNSHAPFDHAGGIAELQQLTGARAIASPWRGGHENRRRGAG
jgi:glyoxylase-like metal-dependent hydrolase (beta-lactamase superfamily II)